MGKYQDKGVGFLKHKGQTVRKPVVNENTGRVGGFHDEHWDGRQDATALPETIRVKGRLSSEGGSDE